MSGASAEHLRALEGAAEEIRHLRNRNAVLQATADTVAIFGAALLGPRREGASHPDPLWQLERVISDVREQQAASSLPTGTAA